MFAVRLSLIAMLGLLSFDVCHAKLAEMQWCSSQLTDQVPAFVAPEYARPLEEVSFEILERVTLKSEEAAVEFRDWFSRIKHHQDSGVPISVLEHTTLVFTLRTGFLDRFPEPALKDEVWAAVERSWLDFTGKEAPEGELLERLPRKVLRNEPREVQQFHAAAFQKLPGRDAHKEAALGRDYVGNLRDLLPATVALAIGFHETGSQLLAGTMMGLAMGSVAEHLIHRFISHAPRRWDRYYDRLGWLGGILKNARYSHSIIHHAKTYRVYNRQFANEAARAEVDALLDREAVDAESIRRSKYGASLALDGVIGGLSITLPFTTALTALVHVGASQMGLHPGLPFDISAVASSTLFMPLSRYVHPYLHLSRAEAIAQAGPVMRWFLDTRYAALISRLHYGHHKSRGGNFNLLFGADALLNQLRKPTVKQLLEMRKLGQLL